MATEGYLLDHEEEYLAAEEIPRLSDRRAERMLGALASGLVLLIARWSSSSFVKAWPSFPHNGLRGSAPAATSTSSSATIFNSGDPPARRPTTRCAPGR